MAEKKFSGRCFRTEPMLATEAIMLQARLLKLVGPAAGRLGGIISASGGSVADDIKSASGASAVSALADVFTTCEPREVAKLVQDVVEIAQIRRPSGEYSAIDLDGDFTDYPGDIYPVAVWVLREQLGPFISGLLGNGSRSAPVNL